MLTHGMRLVTIVAEALAREPLTQLLHKVGAHGYTVSQVEGMGARGERTGEITELANIKIEAIVPATVSEQLMAQLQKQFFPYYGMVAYETDVRVMRSEKF